MQKRPSTLTTPCILRPSVKHASFAEALHPPDDVSQAGRIKGAPVSLTPSTPTTTIRPLHQMKYTTAVLFLAAATATTAIPVPEPAPVSGPDPAGGATVPGPVINYFALSAAKDASTSGRWHEKRDDGVLDRFDLHALDSAEPIPEQGKTGVTPASSASSPSGDDESMVDPGTDAPKPVHPLEQSTIHNYYQLVEQWNCGSPTKDLT
ncbi:hypothetical protein K438DRAFT_2012464 [Mycena galopus ATCC 62051]|nr:hypothetical protein K438DRAFT_2012464 [Mycena galopus ATCC 62051]